MIRSAFALAALLLPSPAQEGGRTVRVSAGKGAIQKALDAASPGDVILVEPGLHQENLVVRKNLTLASLFLESKDPRHVEETVIEGNKKTIVTVPKGVEARIVGLTLRNGDDGVCCDGGSIQVLDCRLQGNHEGISFEGGRGIVRGCLIEKSGDDGIDCDDATDVLVEDNVIRDNRDDGLECRLHDYKGPTLHIVIRKNVFSGNREDGVQLIDYPGLSSRAFRIERNVFVGTAMAAIGCMPDGNTKENYGGAPLQEPVLVLNNTFLDNEYGLTGGDALVAANNLFVGTRKVAMRRLRGDSFASHNLFWRNGTDVEDSRLDEARTLRADPLLDAERRPREGSPAIDAGVAVLDHKGRRIVDLPRDAYAGAAPDLGAFERD